MKGNYHVRIRLKDVFGFAEHQEKPTYGLGYKLTLTRSKDDADLEKASRIADARIKIDNIHWYVPQYTPSIQQQGLLSERIISKILKELRCIERPVFIKEVKNQNLWKFELGSERTTNAPKWIIIGFQQRNRDDSQMINEDKFFRLPVTSVQCLIGLKTILTPVFY